MKPTKCAICGGDLIEGDGKGPHYKSLICADCGHHNGWLKNPKNVQLPRKEFHTYYIESDTFKRLARRCRARAGDFCEVQGCERLGNAAHHISYKHLGQGDDAELADLLWRCFYHHAAVHKRQIARDKARAARTDAA